jgi:outer membrane lipoprotein-sorting protein
MMKKIFVLILIAVGGQALSQDLKAVLTQMREQYNNAEKFKVTMTIQAFDNEQQKNAFYKAEANILRDGNKYLYRFGANEMMMNDHYRIMVDWGTGEMIYDKRNMKTEADALTGGSALSLDSIFRFYETPEYIGDQDGVDQYRVKQKKGPIDQVDLYIKKSSNVLHAISYRYRDKQYVYITFKTFDLKPSIEAQTFDEKRYIVSVKGKLKAVGSYKNLTVLDATKSNF